MDSKTFFIVGTALVIGGCGSATSPSTGGAVAAAPRPAAAPAPSAAASCAMATQSVNTCRSKKPFPWSQERLICELWVGGSPDQPFVYPYHVDVSAPKDMPVIFVWKLLDRRYRFADAASGPTRPVAKIAEPTDPFSDGDTTDDDDGESGSGRPQRSYRWKFASPGKANEYKYIMQFQVEDKSSASGWATISCDPTIRSSGN